ncbi:MAG: hypothetical protein ACRYE8_01110 [Janthinobacterium lividum]
MPSRHCEERSDVAISGNNDEIASSKLTVFPRNDEKMIYATIPPVAWELDPKNNKNTNFISIFNWL